jgi:hypothetical protein
VKLFTLRYLQIRRDLGYWTLIIAVAAFFIAREISAGSLLYCSLLAAALVFLLYNSHLGRKDLNFIENYLGRAKQQVAINYNLLVLPVSAGMLVNKYWLPALLLHFGVSLLVFTKAPRSLPRLAFIGRLIPAQQFEWISGVRTHFYSLVLLLLLAIVLSPVKLFGVMALFLLNSIFLGFYSTFEPLPMLNSCNLPAVDFLKQKVSFSGPERTGQNGIYFLAHP